jgi:hypothetical protein
MFYFLASRRAKYIQQLVIGHQLLIISETWCVAYNDGFDCSELNVFSWKIILLFCGYVCAHHSHVEKKDTLDMSMLQRICIYILSRVLLGYPWASLTFPKRKERLAGHLSNWIPGDAESQETWWRNKPGISCEPAFERVFSRWSLPDLTYYWTVQWSGAQGIYPQLLGCCMI